MRFIPKKKETLMETDVNPLEVNSINLSYDEQYTQAILKAVASESSAIVEYEQILALEPKITEKKLIDLFHDTLIDIKDEEIKHLAQLNTKLSEVSSLKDSYEAGEKEAESGKDISNKDEKIDQNDSKDIEENIKEETQLTESTTIIDENVPQDRTYDADNLAQIIASKYILTDDEYEDIRDLFDPYKETEISAEAVDIGLEKIVLKYKFTPEEKEEIENLIVTKATNPAGERKKELEEDFSYIINTLEDLTNILNTGTAKQKVEDIIQELRSTEYNNENI